MPTLQIAALEIGDSLPLVASVPRWYEVQLPDGTRGFVSKAWTTVSFALGPRQPDELRIHFLNIGAGTCTVVECPGASAPPMILDCGSTGATANDLNATQTRDYVRNVLSQHTTARNVVLSHADLDHYGHIANALNDITVSSIWPGGDPDEYTSNNFPAWISDQKSRGPAFHREFPAGWHNDEIRSARISCGDATTIVLTVNTGTSKNAQSLVLMIEYQDFTVVFTGDEGETEAEAINNFPQLLKATVMTSSHHGASTHGSNSQDWATTTAPEVLVSSAGNKFFHPRCTSTNSFTSVVEPRNMRFAVEIRTATPTPAPSAPTT